MPMKIECCHNCEDRHYKCHSTCERYNAQKIVKIIFEAEDRKQSKVHNDIKNQREIRIAKVMHDKHLRRRK